MGQKYEILAKFFFSKMVFFFCFFCVNWNLKVILILNFVGLCYQIFNSFRLLFFSGGIFGGFAEQDSPSSIFNRFLAGQLNPWVCPRKVMKMKVVAGKLNFHFWFLEKKISFQTLPSPTRLSFPSHKKQNSWKKGQWNFGNQRIVEKKEENFITLLQNLAGSKRCNLWKLWWRLKKIKQQNFDNFVPIFFAATKKIQGRGVKKTEIF
jgi:hypothetical protein